jgi:predicted nucleotidyltransferase
MRFGNYLDELLAKRPYVKLLRAFVLGSPAKEWSGRELARAAGVDHTFASEVMPLFVGYGMASMRRLGNANIYRVNAEHFIVKQSRAFFEAEQLAVERLGAELAKACASDEKIRSATMYGSVARGKGSVGSDVDVLLITSRNVDLAGLFSKAETEFGNTVSPHVWTIGQLGGKRELPLLRNILKEGKHIYGKKLEDLL